MSHDNDQSLFFQQKTEFKTYLHIGSKVSKDEKYDLFCSSTCTQTNHLHFFKSDIFKPDYIVNITWYL